MTASIADFARAAVLVADVAPAMAAVALVDIVTSADCMDFAWLINCARDLIR
jgi:hypothetical protein